MNHGMNEPEGSVIALTGPAFWENVVMYADLLNGKHDFHAVEYHMMTYALMRKNAEAAAPMLSVMGVPDWHLVHGDLMQYVLGLQNLSSLRLLDFDSPEAQLRTILSDNWFEIKKLASRPDLGAMCFAVTSSLRGPGGHRGTDDAAQEIAALWERSGRTVAHEVYERHDYYGMLRRGYSDNGAVCRTEIFIASRRL
jgi:hypothetical protein